MHFTEFIMYEATWKTRPSLKLRSYENPAENQDNLLKGIANLLGVAPSVVYICNTALDQSFSNIYSLFWLQCWPYISKLKLQAILCLHYGNTGCGVFRRGVQNQKDFCLRINILKGNYWILRLGLMGFLSTLQKSEFVKLIILIFHEKKLKTSVN